MKTTKNGIELMIITLQQFSTNNDILTFEFKKPLNFQLQGSLVQIIYETDKLDNIKNNNITIEEKENTIVITWLVKESITLTSGDKRVQIVIKNNGRVYLSNVFIIKVLESLNIDDEIVETNLSYLEYWEQRIKELAEKFDGVDLAEYVTKIELNNTLENYFDKLEIEDKLDEKLDKTALNNLATKEDLKTKANISDVYYKEEVYNKTEVDELIDKDIDLSNYYNKTQVDELVNNKASINDNNASLTSTYSSNKINELIKQSGGNVNIKAGNGIDIDNNIINVKFDNTTIGLNEKGELEAKLSTGGGDDGNINIKQYILKDVKSGTLYTIEDEGLPINHKVIPSVFVLEDSIKSTKTITDFNLNIEDISSNNGIKIQDIYKLDVVNRETPIINKSNFNKIIGFKGGV